VSNFENAVTDGWVCWAFSNHDVVRHATRWAGDFGGSLKHLKLLAALLLSLRGSVCIYQGEELGLTEAALRFEDLQDPYGIEFWPDFKGRDGCRTPMVWDSGQIHGGFSDGKPWLPVPPSHLPLAVDVQDHDPGSLLNHYRRFIAFRRLHPALMTGTIELEKHGDALFCFRRKLRNETIFCAFNLSGEDRTLELPAGRVTVLEHSGFAGCAEDGSITIQAIDAFFGKLD
jgi:alpha-glucosidase